MATVSPPPTIRPAHPADLERIAWLEEAAFADPWPLTLLDYEFKHPRAVLLLASWGEAAPAAGYVAFRHGGGEAELLRLAVAPAERRRGIARSLVDCGLAKLRRENVQSCHLEVRMDNEGAIAFYRALGFERTGRRRNYYRDGTDALVLSLAL